MRDPKRLDNFYDELNRLHQTYFPDLRFGQLMYNFISWYGDPFYLEEKDFLREFKSFISNIINEEVS